MSTITLAEAQERHDNSLPHDVEQIDWLPVLDEMVGEPDTFDNWLSGAILPSSVAALLSLCLSKPLPRNDEENDALIEAMNRVREDFDSWAETPSRGRRAPVDVWYSGGVI